MKCQVCGGALEWRGMWGLGRAYVQCTNCDSTFEHPPPEEEDDEEDPDDDPPEPADE